MERGPVNRSEQLASDRLIDADTAAEVLGVQPNTIRLWARERRLPALKLGKLWRFRQSSLLAWAAEQERAAK